MFFAFGGQVVIQPGPARYFETPIHGPLPEDLGFITGPPPNALSTSSQVTVAASDTGTVTAAFTESPLAGQYGTSDRDLQNSRRHGHGWRQRLRSRFLDIHLRPGRNELDPHRRDQPRPEEGR